jgi:acyl carrier protein
MNKTDLVIEILEDISQWDESDILPDTKLEEEMGLDSLDFVEIAAVIEELTSRPPIHTKWITVQDVINTVMWTPERDED